MSHDNQAISDGMYERLRLLNDELEVFFAVHRIITGPIGGMPAGRESIRELYADFERKHPGVLAAGGTK